MVAVCKNKPQYYLERGIFTSFLTGIDSRIDRDFFLSCPSADESDNGHNDHGMLINLFPLCMTSFTSVVR